MTSFDGRRSALTKILAEVRSRPDSAEKVEGLERLLALLATWTGDLSALPPQATELPMSPLHSLWFALAQALIAAGRAEALLLARHSLPARPHPLLSIEVLIPTPQLLTHHHCSKTSAFWLSSLAGKP